MSFAVDNASLLGYSYKTNFFGDYRFGYIQTYNVEGTITGDFNFKTNTMQNLFSGQNSIQEYALDLKTDQEIIINGKNFGIGRITSLSNSNDINPAAAVKYNLSFEIYGSGSNDLFGMSSALKNQLSGSSLIENFSESFDFSIGRDGFRESSHDISVKYRDLSAGVDDPDGANGVITKAKFLAKGIFDLGTNFDFLQEAFDDLNTVTVKKYYRENYDLINHNCSFSQTFRISKDENNSDDVDHTYEHTFILNPEGIIEVSERGRVQGFIDTNGTQEEAYGFAQAALAGIISNSASRCNTVFQGYLTEPPPYFNEGDEYENLNTNNKIFLRKNHNRYEGYIDYEVAYTNDRKYVDAGYRHEYENLYSKSEDNVFSLQRNGTYKKINQDKVTTFNERSNLIQKLNNSLNTAPNELSAFYTDLGGDSTKLKAINKTINYPAYGNEMTYGINYLDDRGLDIGASLSTYFHRIELTINDAAPTHIYNEYIIPNVKTLFSAGGQTMLGKRNIAFEGIIKKTTSNANFGTNLISSLLTPVKTYIVGQLISNLSQGNSIREIFIENCSYSIDYDFKFSLNLEINYTAIAKNFDTSTVLFD